MKQKAVDGDKVRFGIIGGGNADYERAELVAVCDVLEEKLEPFREQGIPVYTDHLEMLDKVSMDLVVVRTPTHLHVPMASAALERGIHVYGEKPMAVTKPELKGFLKVCEASPAQYRCGLELRHSAVPRRIKEICEQHIGEPVHAFWHIRDYSKAHPNTRFRPWKYLKSHTGGHAVEEMCHFIDLLRFWMNDDVARLCTCSSPIITRWFEDVHDNMTISLWFRGGAAGSVYCSQTGSPVMTYDAGVVGREGAVFWDMIKESDHTERVIVADHVLDDDGMVVEQTVRVVEDYRALGATKCHHDVTGYIQQFIACLLGLDEPVQDYLDAAETFKVCLAAEASAEQGGVVLDPGEWFESV